MYWGPDLLWEDTQHYALTGPLTTVAIPVTLQDSLIVRLEQLGTTRDVAQLEAVVGHEFAYDVASLEGQQVFWKLVEQADVVLENFSPGTADRLGIGYQEVQARKPNIIYTSISCYGYGGPWTPGRGWERQGQAVTGIMERTDTIPEILRPYNLVGIGTGAWPRLQLLWPSTTVSSPAKASTSTLSWRRLPRVTRLPICSIIRAGLPMNHAATRPSALPLCSASIRREMAGYFSMLSRQRRRVCVRSRGYKLPTLRR